jgi:hypothetical protein
MSNVQSSNLLSFPHEPYTKPEQERAPDSVHLKLLKPGDEQTTVTCSILNARPQNIIFDRALYDISPRELPKASKTTPTMNEKKLFLAKLEQIPYARGSFGVTKSKIVNLSGRPVAVVRIGDVRVPFYASSGMNRKKGVTPGKWYPILGICPKTGWFNKTTNMQHYYGSEKLKEAATNLDKFIGDVRGDIETAPPVLRDGEYLVQNFINKDMDPVANQQGSQHHIEKMAALIQKDIIPRVHVTEEFLVF